MCLGLWSPGSSDFISFLPRPLTPHSSPFYSYSTIHTSCPETDKSMIANALWRILWCVPIFLASPHISYIDRAWWRVTVPALHPLSVVLPCWQACKTLRRPRHRLPPSLHAEIQQIKNVRFIAYLNQSLVRAHACFTVSPCFQAGGQDDGISNGLKSSRTQTSASANFPTSQPSPAQKQSNSCRT